MYNFPVPSNPNPFCLMVHFKKIQLWVDQEPGIQHLQLEDLRTVLFAIVCTSDGSGNMSRDHFITQATPASQQA